MSLGCSALLHREPVKTSLWDFPSGRLEAQLQELQEAQSRLEVFTAGCSGQVREDLENL